MEKWKNGNKENLQEVHRHYNGANLGYAFFRLQNLFSCFLFPTDRACRRLSCLERAVCLSVFNLIYSFLLILFHFADFSHTFPLSFLPIPLATYCMLASQTPTQTQLQPLQLRVIFPPFSFFCSGCCCAVYALSFNSSTESTKIRGFEECIAGVWAEYWNSRIRRRTNRFALATSHLQKTSAREM